MVTKQLLKIYWVVYFFRRKFPSGLLLVTLTIIALFGINLISTAVSFVNELTGPSWVITEPTATDTVAEQFFKLPALNNVSGDDMVKLGIRAASHEKN